MTAHGLTPFERMAALVDEEREARGWSAWWWAAGEGYLERRSAGDVARAAHARAEARERGRKAAAIRAGAEG